MAGERTKDITKINITITPETGSSRTLTALFNYKMLEGPEKVEKRESDLKGGVWLRKKDDKSADTEIHVKIGSQDEKYLDNLAENTISFDMSIIDESSKQYQKQYDCKECYISKLPEDDGRDGDNRVYPIIAAEKKLTQL